jgi:Fe-Mn family superoxide dismutase
MTNPKSTMAVDFAGSDANKPAKIYELPKLTYEYGALEPYIDAKTMEIHYTKHHQAYLDKLNGILGKYPNLSHMPLEELLQQAENFFEDTNELHIFVNNAGGHINHSLFWKYLDPANKKDELLNKELLNTFGSVEEFKKQFNDSALKVFGSGWTWLIRDAKTSKLLIKNMPQQNAVIMTGDQPIFGLDVWEHAYYLKYQNKRIDYINAWWQVLKLI